MELRTLIGEDEIKTRVAQLAQEISEFYGNQELCVIVALKGAVIFAADLVRHFNMPLRMEFIRLSSYGNGKVSSGKVEMGEIVLPDLNDKNVLIVEDIIDSGLTAKFLLDFISANFKTKSTKFCSLLDKKFARKADVEADFCAFEIEDKFVVGYGLDYQGLYRNLPYVGYIANV